MTQGGVHSPWISRGDWLLFLSMSIVDSPQDQQYQSLLHRSPLCQSLIPSSINSVDHLCVDCRSTPPTFLIFNIRMKYFVLEPTLLYWGNRRSCLWFTIQLWSICREIRSIIFSWGSYRINETFFQLIPSYRTANWAHYCITAQPSVLSIPKVNSFE